MTYKFFSGFILLIFLLISFSSCDNVSNNLTDRIVIGVASDAETLNPLFAYSGTEIFIAELLYPALIKNSWDTLNSILKTEPFLAEKWEWNNDSSSITFYLRQDAYWTDGQKISADDIIFSFDLYSDPDVQSRYFGSFENFILNPDNRINLQKTFEKTDSFTIKINFKKLTAPHITNVNLPVLPKHIFSNIERKDFSAIEKNPDISGGKLITGGPMILEKWDKNQSIILNANKSFFLFNDDNVNEIIFKIIPDYNSRITQLKKGEIDIMEDIKPEDVEDLQKYDYLKVDAVEGREYDYVAWNNIDPSAYNSKEAGNKKNNIKPHDFFGNKEIRKALTYAINRKEIVEEFLGKFGHISDSPLAPIFKDAQNEKIIPLEYNPSKARNILNKEGWFDNDNDNILEKDGKRFSFNLYYPGGNPRREFSATIIRNNLNAVGINAVPEALEPQVLIQKMLSREIDAWIFGFSVSIPPDLRYFWHSDIGKYPFNVAGYSNPASDKLLNKIQMEKSDSTRNILYKELQEQIYNDMPVTFLFWVDNIVVYNKKIKNINITPLGAFDNCWQWKVDN